MHFSISNLYVCCIFIAYDQMEIKLDCILHNAFFITIFSVMHKGKDWVVNSQYSSHQNTYYVRLLVRVTL